MQGRLTCKQGRAQQRPGPPKEAASIGHPPLPQPLPYIQCGIPRGGAPALGAPWGGLERGLPLFPARVLPPEKPLGVSGQRGLPLPLPVPALPRPCGVLVSVRWRRGGRGPSCR